MLRHLRNLQLMATCAVGFGVLFNFIAIFTYVSFRLAAPPYNFTASLLGTALFTWSAASDALDRTGHPALRARRRLMIGVISAWLVGLALLLAPPLDPDWTFPVRRVRDAVPGDLDGLCHGERS